MSVKTLGIEYAGKTAPINIATSKAGLPDFLARGEHQVNYLWNPFSDASKAYTRDIRSPDIKILVNNDAATGTSLISDKNTGSVIYRGDFDNGFRSGLGFAPIYGPDGSYEGTYRGEWKFSMRHGMGEMAYPDGSVFQGTWSHDRKNGPGMEVMASGGTYMGYWKQDLRHGQGRMLWVVCSQFDVREYNKGKLVASTTRAPREIEKDMNEAKIVKFFAELRIKAPTFEAAALMDELALLAANEPPAPAPFASSPNAKNMLQAAKTGAIPKAAKSISDSVQQKVEVLIDEDSFTKSSTASTAIWMLSAGDGMHTLIPVSKAIADMCKDSFIRECLAEKVKKIKLVNGGSQGTTFVGDTVVVQGAWDKGDANKVDSVKFAEQLNKLL